MNNVYLTELYSGWGWFLWFGIFLLMLSSVGNWGYSYQAQKLYRSGLADKDAIDHLSERYARGDITLSEFSRIKNELIEARTAFKRRGIKADHLLAPSYPREV